MNEREWIESVTGGALSDKKDSKTGIGLGTTFASREEMEESIQEYSDTHFSPFTMYSSKTRKYGNSSLVSRSYRCPFGVYRQSKSEGKRQQNSRYVGCPAALNITQDYENIFTVTRADLDHKEHDVGAEAYARIKKKLTKDQEDAVLSFLEMQPNNLDLSQFLGNLTGKVYTLKESSKLKIYLKKKSCIQ